VRSSLDLIHIHVETGDEPSPVLLTRPLGSSDRHLISMTSRESFAGQLRHLAAVESAVYRGTLITGGAEISAAIPAAFAHALSAGFDGWGGASKGRTSQSAAGWLSEGFPGAEEAGIPQVSFEGEISSFERPGEWLIHLEEVADTVNSAEDELPFGVSSLMAHMVF